MWKLDRTKARISTDKINESEFNVQGKEENVCMD